MKQNIKIQRIKTEIALVNPQYQQFEAKLIVQKVEANVLVAQIESLIAIT